MDFEGPEKKLELVVAPTAGPLRQRPEEFWLRIIRAAEAEVISRIENDECVAFLLSESSLFVFDDRIVMITCGRTTLVAAVSVLLESIAAEDVLSLIYERKNEHFPQLQPMTFEDDVAMLEREFPGNTLLFGDRKGNHISLFHLTREYDADPEDTTFEVLMHDISPAACEMLSKRSGNTAEDIRRCMRIEECMPQFQVDDHLFEPTGYSLNAIYENFYFTIHVTPESECSYASFETNYPDTEALEELVYNLIDFFQPRNFDVLTFQETFDLSPLAEQYRPRNDFSTRLSCGYTVFYGHFAQIGAVQATLAEMAQPVDDPEYWR